MRHKNLEKLQKQGQNTLEKLHNLHVVNRITYLPIYMLMFISKIKSPQSLIYKIDIEGLG